MSKRLTLWLIPLVLLALGAGCGAGEGPRDEVRPTPISAAAEQGGGSADSGGGVGQLIALRLWTPAAETTVAAYEALAGRYAAANPGVTVTVEPIDAAAYEQTVRDALAGGSAADLIQLPGAAICGLVPWLAAAPAPIIALNPPALLDATALGEFTCDGVLYGLPQQSGPALGLVVAARPAAGSQATLSDIAWDFVRFAALDTANAAEWNTTTGTTTAVMP